MRERERERSIYRVLVGKPKGKRDNLKDLDVDRRIILRWIHRKWDGRIALD
jgi:hypothetical protein